MIKSDNNSLQLKLSGKILAQHDNNTVIGKYFLYFSLGKIKK